MPYFGCESMRLHFDTFLNQNRDKYYVEICGSIFKMITFPTSNLTLRNYTTDHEYAF